MDVDGQCMNEEERALKLLARLKGGRGRKASFPAPQPFNIILSVSFY